MVLRPYSADLQKTYRDTLSTPGAPEVIDDSQPVTPVAIVAGTVTATGTITSTPTKVTANVARTSQASAGSATIGTVPANKVWRVIGAWCSIANSGTAAQQIVDVQLNGTSVIGANMQSYAALNDPTGNANSIQFGYDACPVLTAGQTAVLVVTNAGNATGGITYVQEDA